MKRFSRHHIFWLLFLIPFLFHGNINGQESVRFDRIGFREGLSQGAIYGIIQDNTGFMWFGTKDGLIKFNGCEFTVYKNEPDSPNSLSDSFINRLCIDQQGNIWIGNETGGIDKLDPESEKFTRYRLPVSNTSVFGDKSIEALYVDSDGSLWASQNGGGFFKYNQIDDRFDIFHSTGDDDISVQQKTIAHMREDKSGQLWLSIRDLGPHSINGKDGKIDKNSNSLTSLYNADSWGDALLFEDSSDRLWIGTWGSGIFQMNNQKNALVPVRLPPTIRFGANRGYIRCFLEDRSGNIWIGTANSGLLLFDRQRNEFIQFTHDPTDQYSLSSNEIECIYEDASETIWVGTLHGLNKYNKYKYKFGYIRKDLPVEGEGTGSYVFSVGEDSKRNLWIGSMMRGLSRYSPAKELLQNYDLTGGGTQIENTAYSILTDSRGELYVGTADRGVLKFDPTANGFIGISAPQHVSDILEDSNNEIWIATNVNGIGKYNRSNGDFEYYEFRLEEQNKTSTFDVNVLYEDRAGNLWVGTDGSGLIKLFKDRSLYVHYEHISNNPDSLSDDRVLSLYEDGDGFIWVGTRNGLNKFDTDSVTFKRFYEQDGLPNNVIYGILPDDDEYLWMSTNLGLAKFDPRSETCWKYGMYDGLIEYGFNAGAFYRSRAGELFFGGGKYLYYFKPDELQHNSHVPKIVITSFRKLDKDVKFDRRIDQLDEIVLSYDENFFSFEFAALDYAEINANRYAYMLEGADKDWITAGTRRSASYIQVNPGDYVFRVKGTNNDGVWNEEGASVHVRILPPFWMTAQFQILMAIVGIAVLITVYKLRTSAIKRQRNILQREVDERKVAESKLLSNQQRLRKLASELTLAEERERRRIAEGLHDQIGQNLAFTKRRLGSLKKESKDKLVSKSLEPVISLIGDTINDTRSLTLEISPPILYQLGLKSALKWLVEHFKNQHGIPAKFKDDGLSKPLDENLPVLLFQSVRELLFNVVKHAKANHLEVSMSRMDDNICISITDDGVGFDAETLSGEWKPGSGFGIFSIQERLNPFGGKLVIRSKPGEGTTSTLYAPLDTAHAELEE